MNRDPGYGWFGGLVRDVVRRSSSDPWFGDFIEGEDATFVLGVSPPDGTFRVQVTLGDPEAPRGPVRVTVNDRVAGAPVVTEAGERRDLLAETTASKGRLSVRFLSEGCRGFAVSGLVVSGPPGARLERLFPPRPDRDDIPPPEELPRMGEHEKRALLRQLCDFLIDFQPRQGGFSYHGAWYQNAFPIRTLIAGSLVLKEPRYAAPAIRCLDWFVDRQLPDGNWLSSYFASPACDTVVPPDTASANLADIGTMTTCLSLVAPYVDQARRERYLKAAALYASNISLLNQYEDGAFMNRRWSGKDSLHPYSVATATQVMSLQALYNVTGDPTCLEAAERGAWWLARRTFLADGRVAIYPHDTNVVQISPSTRFGEIFYIADALILVRNSTRDDSLRKAIDDGFDSWLFGRQGLKALAENGYWWRAADAWTDSKMAGMPYVLAQHPCLNEDPGLKAWLERTLGWMADPGRRQAIGVTAPPASLVGQYALTATGFAGIGVAAAIQKDVLTPSLYPLSEPVTFSLPGEDPTDPAKPE